MRRAAPDVEPLLAPNHSDLESTKAWVSGHVLPMATVAADKVAGNAHLAPLGSVTRTGVMMRLSFLDSTLAAIAHSGLRHAKRHPVRRVVRARSCIMIGFPAGAAVPNTHRLF